MAKLYLVLWLKYPFSFLFSADTLSLPLNHPKMINLCLSEKLGARELGSIRFFGHGSGGMLVLILCFVMYMRVLTCYSHLSDRDEQ